MTSRESPRSSISGQPQLCADAERDRDAVGVPLPIVHQAKFKSTDAIPADSSVFFTTYTMLSADFGGERPRFKQLTEWLGPDFDGVIAFDEAHLMKNAAGTLPRAPTAAPAPKDSGV